MKQMQTRQLLESLESDTRKIILAATYLLQEDPALLVQQPAAGKWSVAQVLEHLNSYGRYYLSAIESALNSHIYPYNAVFRPGWLGNYFTRSMLPGKDGQVTNRMQSPKDHCPQASVDSKAAMDEFLEQQQLLLELLERAKQTDIGRIRIPITLTKLIRLKLGDTFRFLIAHQQRHFVQVKNTLRSVKEMEPTVLT
jgi:uncharacterized damage-inducible protein DinB